jgi:hypothetical protein
MVSEVEVVEGGGEADSLSRDENPPACFAVGDLHNPHVPGTREESEDLVERHKS